MRKETNDSSRPWRQYVHEELKDEKAALEYLEVAVEEYEEDGDRQAFLLAVRTVAEAQEVGLARCATVAFGGSAYQLYALRPRG